MGRKFIFNPVSLEYEIKKISLKEFIKKFFTSTFIILATGITLGYILYLNIETFEEKHLKENISQINWSINSVTENIDLQQKRVYKLEYYDNIYRTILGLKTSKNSTIGMGGEVERNFINISEISNEVKKYILISSIINSKIKSQSNSYNYIKNDLKEKDDKYSSIPYTSPLQKNDIKNLGRSIGIRFHPVHKVFMMHTGLDMSANTGTPIFATGDGIVVTAGANNGYGLCIKINHGYNYQTRYAHLSKIVVSPGEIVKRGQLIGYVGNTGVSTSPHLHYEVRYSSRPLDPRKYINDIAQEYFDQILQQNNIDN